MPIPRSIPYITFAIAGASLYVQIYVLNPWHSEINHNFAAAEDEVSHDEKPSIGRADERRIGRIEASVTRVRDKLRVLQERRNAPVPLPASTKGVLEELEEVRKGEGKTL